MSSKSIQGRIFKAKLAEQTERFEDMAAEMKAVIAEIDRELSEDERNLFSIAFKSLVGTRRFSWRVITNLEQKLSNSPEVDLAREMRRKIETEIRELCQEVLDLVENSLQPKATTSQCTVFYLKLRGDYSRYLAEIIDDVSKADTVEFARKAYEDALDIAKAQLPSTCPTRLGLALNYAVFYFEILGDTVAACKVARDAFEEAIADLDTLNEDSFKDSTIILQMIRDNLSIWHSHLDNEYVRSNDNSDSQHDVEMHLRPPNSN